MEAIAVLTLATLALLVWKTLEVNEKAEQIDARLNNIDVVIAEYYKMLKNLQPKEPIEIPVRLDQDKLKMIFKQLPIEDQTRKYGPEDGNIWFGDDEAPEPNEALKMGAEEYFKKKRFTENEKAVLEKLYGNKGAIVQGTVPENPTIKDIVEHATKFNGSYHIVGDKTKQKQAIIDMMRGDEELGLYDKDDIEEMKVWDSTLMDGMDDTQYGNEGSTFSLYEDEQLKKIRKHVQERKKQSLNK